MLILFFLLLESRRYRYFNVWRARARWLETHFHAPLLQNNCPDELEDWHEILAKDYRTPKYHVSFFQAFGRRLRSSYLWLLLIQTFAYAGKIMVHPIALSSVDDVWARAAIGPVPGEWVVLAGIIYIATGLFITVYTWRIDQARHRSRNAVQAMG